MNRLHIILLIVCTILACGCKKQQILPETELAFCDFVLGGDFEECYNQAREGKRYEDLSNYKEGLLEHATFFKIELPNYENPDFNISAMMGKIDSYQGKIYHINYDSYWVNTIIKMYQTKYGTVEPKKYERIEPYYVRSTKLEKTIVHIVYKWLFENAHLTVEERYQDEYGSKKDDIVIVNYTDINGLKEAQPYIEYLFNQKDSIEQVEAERERIMREEREREEQRIKKERENAILESIRF